MTDDLVAFLRARLNEDAKLAKSGETWSAFEETQQGTRRVDVDHSIERVVACTRSWRGLHIARHDPARVLADVEAKREMVDEHQDVNDGSCAHWGYPTHGGSSPQRYPCRTLRLLALPYTDHPDYRDEWRP
jgi:hypothetical protein